MEKFNNEIIVWLSRIHVTNEAVRFWVLTGELLTVSIECYQLRVGGETKWKKLSDTPFFLYCCQQHAPLEPRLLKNVNLMFYLRHRFLQRSPGLWFWLVLRFPLSRLTCDITKPWNVVLHKELFPAPGLQTSLKICDQVSLCSPLAPRDKITCATF